MAWATVAGPPEVLAALKEEKKAGRVRYIGVFTIVVKNQAAQLEALRQKGLKAGIETRGISDHGFIRSIYYRDPNGYVIELTAKVPGTEAAMDPAANGARATLDRWQEQKRKSNAAD